ncbi:hypothetical protein ASA1KI_35550 [Opitutales bacterium ASA1]|nr:hypothetical protein ASA1KI_35550 [Opitutales bacterium ASA1]
MIRHVGIEEGESDARGGVRKRSGRLYGDSAEAIDTTGARHGIEQSAEVTLAVEDLVVGCFAKHGKEVEDVFGGIAGMLEAESCG